MTNPNDIDQLSIDRSNVNNTRASNITKLLVTIVLLSLLYFATTLLIQADDGQVSNAITPNSTTIKLDQTVEENKPTVNNQPSTQFHGNAILPNSNSFGA